MAPTGCAIPECKWHSGKSSNDPRHLFQVQKFVKGKDKKKDRDILYEVVSSLRGDVDNFQSMYHKGK